MITFPGPCRFRTNIQNYLTNSLIAMKQPEYFEGTLVKDVELVINQTGVPWEKALQTLQNNNSDIVETIMELSELSE